MSDNFDYKNEIIRAGLIPVNAFETGFTLTSSSQALYSGATNEYFIWKGAFPKVVAAGASPESSGGFGPTAWANVSYLGIGSTSGTAIIGHGQTKLDDILSVDVRQFGAKTISEDPNFDSQPAFQAAIEYVRSKGGGNIRFSGHYKILKAPFNYILPFDDGKYSPNFISGEKQLDPEPQYTIPACLQLYSRCILMADGIVTSSLDFGWDADSGPIEWDATKGLIHGSQSIGIVARVQGYENGTNTRMNTFINRAGVDGFDVKNAFIGFLADGIMFNQSRLGHMQWVNCGFPVIIQGADSNMWGNQALINSYAGIIVGGMWLQRNNVQLGGKWVPPYIDGMDIYSLGWCDYLHFTNITLSGRSWTSRHNDIDTFFDTYFYKSSNSKREMDGGRLTNKDMTGNVSNYDYDPFRGVAGRAFSLISRYKRGNSVGKLVDNAKIYFSPRTPFWTPNMGTSWYGYIDYAFVEQVGLINRDGGTGADNDFYSSDLDPWNTDQKIIPGAVVEGAIQCQRVGYATMIKQSAATTATVTNDRKNQTNWIANWDTWQVAPKTNDTCLRYGLIIDNSFNSLIFERLWPGRYEIQPLCFNHGDKNELHHWRTRTSKNEVGEFKLRDGNSGGVIPGDVKRSLVYRGGIVDCYFEFKVPSDAASRNTFLCISGFPNSSYGTHDFGNDSPYLNIIQAHPVPRIRPVIGGSGSVSIPTPIIGCSQDAGKVLFFVDHFRSEGVRYADLVPGSIFSAVVTYNTTWSMYNNDEGLNGSQK